MDVERDQGGGHLLFQRPARAGIIVAGGVAFGQVDEAQLFVSGGGGPHVRRAAAFDLAGGRDGHIWLHDIPDELQLAGDDVVAVDGA